MPKQSFFGDNQYKIESRIISHELNAIMSKLDPLIAKDRSLSPSKANVEALLEKIKFSAKDAQESYTPEKFDITVRSSASKDWVEMISEVLTLKISLSLLDSYAEDKGKTENPPSISGPK